MEIFRYDIGASNKCPHCGTFVTFVQAKNLHYRHRAGERQYPTFMGVQGEKQNIYINSCLCPYCNKPITSAKLITPENTIEYLVHPRNSVRFIPKEVPTEIANDFQEASSVISISQKASAALSRRCLQNLLIDVGAPPKENLSKQIDWAIDSTPSYIADDIDHIRHVGNFAAHPNKDNHTGDIIDVEEGEAEWNLDVLELLFDYYYVQPKKAEDRRNKLNVKLASMGKNPMKKT